MGEEAWVCVKGEYNGTGSRPCSVGVAPLRRVGRPREGHAVHHQKDEQHRQVDDGVPDTENGVLARAAAAVGNDRCHEMGEGQRHVIEARRWNA